VRSNLLATYRGWKNNLSTPSKSQKIYWYIFYWTRSSSKSLANKQTDRQTSILYTGCPTRHNYLLWSLFLRKLWLFNIFLINLMIFNIFFYFLGKMAKTKFRPYSESPLYGKWVYPQRTSYKSIKILKIDIILKYLL